MVPEDCDKIVLRLLATWPTPKMADSQRLIWYEHLGTLAHAPAVAALLYLEKNADHRPSIAKFHEAYAAQHYAPDGALRRGECHACDDGWVQVRCAICDCGPEFDAGGRCPKGPGTSARCPSGCKPKTAAEREALLQEQDHQWKREHAQPRMVSVPDLRDPSGPNRRDDDPMVF